MALKAMIFFMVSFLLVTTRAGPPVLVAPVKAPLPAPVKPPATATPKLLPPVKAPAQKLPPPVKAPPPVPVKPPAPTPKLLPPVNIRECPRLCGGRCKLVLPSKRKNCLRACMTCCKRCKCVPPGTYGNRERCGKCYTSMKTHRNRPKCP